MACPISVSNTFGFSLISCLIMICKSSVKSFNVHNHQNITAFSAIMFPHFLRVFLALCDFYIVMLWCGVKNTLQWYLHCA